MAHQFSRVLWAGGLTLTTGVFACQVTLDVPKGVVITCDRDAECPAGYMCLPEVGRCVEANKSFDTANVIASSVSVTPNVRARNTVATVSFAVDGAVGEAPSVRWLWRGGEAVSSLTTTGEDGASFVYTYTVGDDEPEGFASLAIGTVSQSGIPASFELPQALLFDFTPPALVPDTLSTAFAPPPSAVLASVTALGLEGEVTILFALSEPTAGDVSLEIEPSEALAAACSAPVGTMHQCTLQLTAPPAIQGPHTIYVIATDAAGNTSRIKLTEITFDTLAPLPPATAAGRLRYVRAPYGADETAGAREFWLAGGAGAAEASARLVVFDDADIAGASHIGEGVADSQGAVAPLELVPADRALVYAVVVDAAGNVSDDDPVAPGTQATLVREITWIATLRGKQALDVFSNPHRLRYYGIQPDALFGATSPEVSDSGTLGRSDGQALSVAGAGTWLRLVPAQSPAGGTTLFSTYTDTWRGELRVIQAGTEVWRFTGSAWEALTVRDPEFDGEPAAANNGVAFDAQRGELVLLGSNNLSGDTWLFNGESWRSAQASGGPRVDYGTMVYDDRRGQVLLFGGYKGANGTNAAGDTWAWDGSSWSLLTSSGPEPRGEAVAVFDSAVGRVILHGGIRYLPSPLTDCGGGLTTTPGGQCDYTDTWSWDGESWTRLCDAVSADCGDEPTPRSGAALAYDPSRQRAVLYGGGYTAACGGDAMCSDFYEWNGSAWSRASVIDPAGDGSPSGRVEPILGWDPLGNRLLMTSGEDEFLACGGTNCRETWQWTGSDWLMLLDPVLATPTMRGAAFFAHDGARNELVMQGGTNEWTDTTWVFNGRFWSSFTVGNPAVRTDPASVSTPNGVYRFGGVLLGSSNSGDDLYRRLGTTWSLESATVKPLFRFGAGATHVTSAATPYILLYGGAAFKGAALPACPEGDTGTLCYLSNTWGWGVWGTPTCASAGASCWREFTVVGPSRRYDASLVHTSNGQALLFGGFGAGGVQLGDTWLWTGSTWQQVTGPGPAARTNHVSVYDQRREKVVVAGGSAADDTLCGARANGLPCPDVWEFDGSSWGERVVADPENDGGFAGTPGRAVYWPSLDGMITPDQSCSGCLWRWNGGYDERPGLVAEIDFSASGAPSDAVIDRVDLHATASASSQASGAQTSEVSLLAGEPLGWREVDSASSDNGIAASLSYCASRVDIGVECEVMRDAKLLLGASRTILLGVAPAGTNGTASATVALDYAEVRVQYRLP